MFGLKILIDKRQNFHFSQMTVSYITFGVNLGREAKGNERKGKKEF